jgi:hypothetical protein
VRSSFLQQQGSTEKTPMLVRFDICPDEEGGWTIYDRATNRPVRIEGYLSVGLAFHDADDLVDLLNTLHVLRGQPPLH